MFDVHVVFAVNSIEGDEHHTYHFASEGDAACYVDSLALDPSVLDYYCSWLDDEEQHGWPFDRDEMPF